LGATGKDAASSSGELAIISSQTAEFGCGDPYRKRASALRLLSALRVQQRRCSGTLRHFSSVEQMSVLFNDARFNAGARPRARLSTGLWLSVVAHATLAGVLAVVPTRASEKPRPRSIPVFLMPSTETVKLRRVSIEAPRVPVPLRPVHEAVIAKAPELLAVKPLVTKPVEPAPAALLPAKVPAFERPLETKAPERPSETGVFERANGPKTSQAAAAVTTGGFETTVTASRGTGQSAAVVATGGFGSGASSMRGIGRASDAAVTTGGFGSGASSPRGAANGFDNVNVQTAGFDVRPSAPVQSPGAAALKPIDRPVEIVFKPTPEYTDEARSARIEGTVSLELEFTATGDIRVLRLMRGLGHGLDEAAERAARRIRFKPAQSDGRAVDSRATVHITFRLS
jgi:TonB family protein